MDFITMKGFDLLGSQVMVPDGMRSSNQVHVSILVEQVYSLAGANLCSHLHSVGPECGPAELPVSSLE